MSPSPDFTLDHRLQADTMLIGDLELSRLLLMNDARYPWVILVPRRSGLVEITDLNETESLAAMREMRRVAQAMQAICPHDKLNIGALGNVVRQLHIHLVARRAGDEAGHGPVWGIGKALPYAPQAAEKLISEFRNAPGLM